MAPAVRSRASRKAQAIECKKVAVLGAAGGIGQPLSLLLKMNRLVTELSLHDIANVVGVAADLSHCNTPVKVGSFVSCRCATARGTTPAVLINYHMPTSCFGWPASRPTCRLCRMVTVGSWLTAPRQAVQQSFAHTHRVTVDALVITMQHVVISGLHSHHPLSGLQLQITCHSGGCFCSTELMSSAVPHRALPGRRRPAPCLNVYLPYTRPCLRC